MKRQANKRVVFIGAGNLASSLAPAMSNAGYQIIQIYSKTRKSAQSLGNELQTAYTTKLSLVRTDADIYIISVKDDVIKKIASSLKLPGRAVFHTSGSVSLKTLENISLNTGVLYPLQSFTKAKAVSFEDIPVMVEASNTRTFSLLKQVVRKIKGKSIRLSSEQRLNLHLAAVFACNFSNHFYRIAEDLLKDSGLKFSILYPLIEETTKRVKKGSPAKFQTGPAARGDKRTMKKHQGLLKKKDPALLKLYKLISQDIMRQNKHTD